MTPDDPRHGTYAGNVAHYKAGERPCPPCADAGRRYGKQRKLDAHRGQARLLPAIGYQRRIRALQAIGYTFGDICSLLDVTRGTLSNRTYRSEWVSAKNHAQLAAVYDRVSMAPNPTPDLRTIRNARRKGFAPPLAWDDIDDPNERPNGLEEGGAPEGGGVDPIVVERFLRRDISPGMWANQAEKREIARRWQGSLSELARMTGWKIERYHKRGDAA